MYIEALRGLYFNMSERNVDYHVFSYRHNNLAMRVIFSIAGPQLLCFLVVGTPIVFVNTVRYGSHIDPQIEPETTRQALIALLRRDERSNHAFEDAEFFQEFAERVPRRVDARVLPEPHEMDIFDRVRAGRDIDEKAKRFAIGYRFNKNGRHVSKANLAKTKRLVPDARIAELSERLNISLCWSDRPERAIPIQNILDAIEKLDNHRDGEK